MPVILLGVWGWLVFAVGGTASVVILGVTARWILEGRSAKKLAEDNAALVEAWQADGVRGVELALHTRRMVHSEREGRLLAEVFSARQEAQAAKAAAAPAQAPAPAPEPEQAPPPPANRRKAAAS